MALIGGCLVFDFGGELFGFFGGDFVVEGFVDHDGRRLVAVGEAFDVFDGHGAVGGDFVEAGVEGVLEGLAGFVGAVEVAA